MIGRRVKRSRRGGFDVKMPAEERELLRSLGPQMRVILTRPDPAEDADPAVERLFPVAYPTDEDRQTEYRLLIQDELMESHLGALAALEETADAEHLDEDQLMAWMRAVNDVRLVLGTRLEIADDGADRPRDRRDPRTPAFAVYDYLTYLQGEIVDALSG
jgi:hypothetical protein